MIVKTKAIVLRTVRYQDKGLIVRCFTQESGIKSYYVRNAFSRAKGSLNIAYFRPLSLLEIEAQHKDKGGLEYIKEVKIAYPYQTIYCDFKKNSIGVFISEVLCQIIKEEEPNSSFFEFLEASLLWLDHHDEVANFHLMVLMGITKHLGFYPDTSSMDLPWFNPMNGNFSNNFEKECFNEEETYLFKRLIMHSFRSNQAVFSSRERNKLLNLMLRYCDLHVSGFRKPNSLEVLKEVFLDLE